MKATIILADDHPLMRQGIRNLLERGTRLVVQLAANQRKLQASVAVLDRDLLLVGVLGALHDDQIGGNLLTLKAFPERSDDAAVRGRDAVRHDAWSDKRVGPARSKI